MNDKVRQEYNKYMREYRKKNKEKIKEIKQRYFEQKALGEGTEFKKELMNDSETMKELKSEKISERLENGETGAFYVADLENEILGEIERGIN